MGIVILYLMSLFYPSSAMGLTVVKKAIQKGAPPKATTASSSKAKPNIVAQAVQRDVVNIVVDRIEGALIYSKDWRTFEVPSTTKVIDNRHRVTKMRTAELVFENGSLVAVTLK
jgi:Na+-transporting methylmalonyl-CoA/oxaloacetate decarboxylase gamma subunit